MLLTLRLACRRAGKGIPQTTGYRHLLQAYELRLSPGPALPSDAIDKARNLKIISEVKQDGQNFTWSQQYPGGHSITNTFTIGKECDIETIGGKKFKVRGRQPPSLLPSHVPPAPQLLPRLRL